MSSSVRDLPQRLPENQREALVRLLADEDPAVFWEVRQKILSYGPEAMDWLRPHLLSDDPLMRKRVKGLLTHLQRQDADNEFLSFCLRQGDDFDLEDGAMLLAKTSYPTINVEGYSAILDAYAKALKVRLEKVSGARPVLEVISHFIFKELDFSGNEDDYYNPENSYLNKVLDSRTGNPISLSTVLLLLGVRLRLPLAGIGLPGHFICRYQNATDELFIDAFNRGRLVNKADCIRYLHSGHDLLSEKTFIPYTSRRILMRMCANLHQIFQLKEQPDETMRFQRYLVALAR